MSNAAAKESRTPATGLAITIEFIEGDTERHDRLVDTTHGPRDFEAVLAQVAANAPAGGAYDKTEIALRWRATNSSQLAARGEALELRLRLDVTRDFGSLAAYLDAVGDRYAYFAKHGRLPDRECPFLEREQAQELASLFGEALEAYMGTRLADGLSLVH